ncbi:MAG: IS30 family transposase [Lachnospiraceae bacterium]|nr:IS30 family transposase [Lachnospiraceae bacterium]
MSRVVGLFSFGVLSATFTKREAFSVYKHLTIEQRVLIEDRLNKRISIRAIAKELGVAPSTILREIKRHTVVSKAITNDCAIRQGCIHKNLCNDKYCARLCSKCKSVNCVLYCTDYIKDSCGKRYEPLHICNGCNAVHICPHEKEVYRANTADRQYRNDLVASRTGFDVTDKEMEKIDALASPLIKNGLSPYHVKQTLGEELPVSESTLRRMIDRCELNARNIDLRDKVKRSPRDKTQNKNRNKTLSVSKVGRFYEDYLKYINDNDTTTVEMDCVEGTKEDTKALLTLTWIELSLQIALVLQEKTSERVVEALDKLEDALGSELFKEVFPLILTDNGGEFTDIPGMETSKGGFKRTKIFFCDPNRSDQKGTCENHHKMIRYCIPKGTRLDPFDQFDISLMMNHINSYKRKALFGKSAFELAKGALPEDFFILLGMEEIDPTEIVLTPKLFLHSKCNG